MKSTVSIRVLVENTVQTGGLRAEHGLAWWLEREGRRVLFDTGQTGLVVENAAVLGGAHLIQASEERLEATMRALAEMEIRLLVPGHCTGLPATVRLWSRFPGRCAGLGVGSRFVFEG